MQRYKLRSVTQSLKKLTVHQQEHCKQDLRQNTLKLLSNSPSNFTFH